MNDLTWQEWRSSACPMESSATLTNHDDQDRSAPDSDRPSVSNPKRADDGRLMYFEHQLQPNPDYRGILDDLTIDEGRALFEELLSRFRLYDFYGFPLPPAGLPGFLHYGYKEESAAGQMISLGVRYAMAIVRNERRAMHLRWREAEELARQIAREAEEAVFLEQARQTMRDCEAREVRQSVYFIGSNDGPVKIGIAANPQARLSNLQTGHHEKLRIFAICDGGAEQEKAYHKRFAAHRLSGEWFARCPEIEAEIARLNASVIQGQSTGDVG